MEISKNNMCNILAGNYLFKTKQISVRNHHTNNIHTPEVQSKHHNTTKAKS